MFKRIATYKITTIITCTLSILNAMFYFSMRCIWSGIGKVLNGNQMIPLVIMGVFVLVAIIAWVLAWLRKEKILMYITLFITLVLDVGLFFIIKLGASDYLLFILRDFLDCLLYGIAILLVVWIIYFYSDSKLTKMKVLKS
ncbi:MAG: hypothetical protein PHO86_02670, partial [Bacilli bacterium]|nr:hypothetical protein [Bacilli bacterium]